jgi:hypothetical protein
MKAFPVLRARNALQLASAAMSKMSKLLSSTTYVVGTLLMAFGWACVVVQAMPSSPGTTRESLQ